MSGRGAQAPRERAIVYCIVPAELAHRLHESLRRHFADDRAVEVVVEQRRRDRRRRGDRRTDDASTPSDRRRVRAAEGRRVAERRLAHIAVDLPQALPRKARPYADQLVFLERIEPSTQHAEDLDSARLVTRFQAGETDLFEALYLRYFDRIYGYLNVVLGNAHDAEDAAQECMLRILKALPRYERRSQPLRAWIFKIVRNHALDRLERSRRFEVVESAEIDSRRELLDSDTDELPILDWISDRELGLFIDRLPLAQRQVLVLRYLVDLTDVQIAAVMDRSASDVRMLQSRAVRTLRDRLSAVGRAPKPTRRSPMRRAPGHASVLRGRRWALVRY